MRPSFRGAFEFAAADRDQIRVELRNAQSRSPLPHWCSSGLPIRRTSSATRTFRIRWPDSGRWVTIISTIVEQFEFSVEGLRLENEAISLIANQSRSWKSRSSNFLAIEANWTHTKMHLHIPGSLPKRDEFACRIVNDARNGRSYCPPRTWTGLVATHDRLRQQPSLNDAAEVALVSLPLVGQYRSSGHLVESSPTFRV